MLSKDSRSASSDAQSRCIASLDPAYSSPPYRECLAVELVDAGLNVERECLVSVVYKGRVVLRALKIDLLIESQLVVEVKAFESIHPVHLAQVITYLKLTGNPAGLLLNFKSVTLRAGLRRLDHPDRYKRFRSSR